MVRNGCHGREGRVALVERSTRSLDKRGRNGDEDDDRDVPTARTRWLPADEADEDAAPDAANRDIDFKVDPGERLACVPFTWPLISALKKSAEPTRPASSMLCASITIAMSTSV